MDNANKKILIRKLAIFSIVGAMAIGQVTIASIGARVDTHAATSSPSQEMEYVDNTVYCDDPVYSETTDGELSFQGQGEHTVVSYTIECDEMVILESAGGYSVPSFGYSNPEWSNACGPVAGLNIVTFYDRFFPNLLPDFEPGMVASTGLYRYYPDLSMTATETALESLYDLMDVANVGGTTAANFQSGLTSFVQNAGYSISYSSMHQNSATVNLSTLTNAVNQNKVGLVMCSQYNFVYSMQMGGDGTYASVGKIHSSVGHMMMVYGYKTVGFYKDGDLVTTKTFLNVCSGYSTCEKGYMELNDSAVINNALVVSIT